MDSRSTATAGDDYDDGDSGVSPRRVISLPKVVTFLVVINLWFFRPTDDRRAGSAAAAAAAAATGDADGGAPIGNAWPAWGRLVAADPAALSAAPPTLLPLMARLDDAALPAADVPFFLHCPKAGGTTVTHLLITVYHFGSPRKVGTSADIDELVAARGARGPWHPWRKGDEGRARQHQQPIITPLFFDAQRLLEPEHRGRMFTVLRHPVYRLHSLFHYLRMNPPWEKHGRDRSDLKNMTFAGRWALMLDTNPLAHATAP